MTLGDLLRKYLEDRRRVCEEKARRLEGGSDFQYFSKQNEGVNSEKDEEKKLFSNTLNPTPVRRKPKTKLNDECTDCKTATTSTSKTVRSRMITLPNGKIQVETIIKDGNGNEEKRLTYQEGDKVYTTITRRDAAGNEKVEQKVEDASSTTSDYNNSVIIFPDQFFGINNQRQSAESGYDDWFNRFFRPRNATPPSQDEMSPFDVGNLDDTLAQIIKMFDIDPFTGKPRNLPPNEQDPFNSGWFFDDSNKDINDTFRESRRFTDKAEMDEPFSQPQPMPKKKASPRKENVSQFVNDISTPKTSLFTEFAERAIAKIPEEETPLDKFIEPDKRKKQKQLEILKETAQFMNVLKEYFENDRYKNSYDVVPYFTVQRRPQFKNQISSFPSKSTTAADRQISDLESLVAGYSGPPTTMKIRAGSTTEIRFPNGNTRTQKIVRDKDGNTETRITYRSGKKTYTVIKVTNPAGDVLQRQKKSNFRDDQLNEFKKQWDKKYQSDFDE